MKNIHYILAGFSTIVLLAACGGGDSIDAKKAELEKLRTEQAELVSRIAALEEEILRSGDSSLTEDKQAKFIATTPLKRQTFINGIDVQGEVDGDENIVYSARVPAEVRRINVRVGDRVKAGQVMAELDGAVVSSQLEALKKQYELANTVYEKRKALWDQKIGSEIEYLQAKNTKESLEKQIVSVKENLDMYLIRADFSGTVDVMSLKVGEPASPGMPAIVVVGAGGLKLNAQLSEANIGQVRKGDEVTAFFPDINKTIKAKVTYASRTINPLTRTFNVQIALPDDDDLSPHMVAKIQFVNYKKEGSIVVPINTIQQVDGQDVVFIAVKQDKKLVAKKMPVKVGRMYNGLAEILGGLNEGEELITTGFQDLTDGQSLKQ